MSSLSSLKLVYKYLLLQPIIHLIAMVVPSLDREATGRSCHVLATLKATVSMTKVCHYVSDVDFS